MIKAFELGELDRRHATSGQLYLEFLKVPDLSMGLYALAAGAADPQGPHAEDEVYYVVAGRGQIEVEGQSRPVRAGSIVYVPARARHRFHTITEELRVLVFFAPAESGAP